MGKDYGKIIYRKETGAYVVDKLCVPHPDDNSVPEEIRDAFAPQWADVHAYAEAHPEMVTEEQPYVPPVPTLDDLRAAKLAEIAAGHDAALTATLTMPAASPGSAEIALAVQDFIAVDAEGLEYVRGLLAARRDELERAALAAQAREALEAVRVGYPV